VLSSQHHYIHHPSSIMMQVVALLVIIVALAAVQVEAFSAHLTRPWETPNMHSVTGGSGKRNTALLRLYVAELEKSKQSEKTSNAIDDENDEEDNNDEDEDGDNDDKIPGFSSRILSSGTTVAATATSTTASATHSTHSVAVIPFNGNGNGNSAPRRPMSTRTRTRTSTSTALHAALSADDIDIPPPSPSSNNNNNNPKPTVKSHLPDLIAMTRPSNLPGVVLFHMLGTYLAIQNTNINFWHLLLSPSMMVTLLALLLTSSTSMLVNDYYDYKLGHDSNKLYKPLTSHKLPLAVAKRFLSYLYAAALLCVSMLPGAPARMSVVTGLMLTFWYTQHLKPRTWLKNAVCASLIALSPLTSGMAAMSLGRVVGLSSSSWQTTTNGLVPLLKVVAMLFAGILGREITMDINDVQDDMDHGVRTVPVVYGRKFASSIGLACAGGVASLAMSGPILQCYYYNNNNMGAPISKAILRRLLFASLGSVAQVRRAWQVFRTEGQDTSVVKTAVEEGLLSVVLLLASFV
jgi:4-hydroxybenzoate polyprenyltransferase